MLRGILRNVQFYLLFFSVLLVLLAFQRLQWYDQGLILHPHHFLEGNELMGGFRTSYGRSMLSSDSGEDSAGGRIYYGGDESKEIGLLKFRIGLFKFVLPTFSKDTTSSWSQNNEQLLIVPPPPNERRRNNSKKARRKNKSHVNNLDTYTTIERKEDGVKFGASVAYVALIPPHFSPTPSFGAQGVDESPQQSCQLAKQARLLKKSIEKAHGVNSKYDYRLYAISIAQKKKSGRDLEVGTGTFTKEFCHVALQKVGYKLIEIDAINVENTEKILKSVFDHHEIIVQTSFESFLLLPLDDLFETLLQSTVDKGGIKFKNQIESFSLEILSGHRKHEKPKLSHKRYSGKVAPFSVKMDDLFIFRSNSLQTMKSYISLLKCFATSAMKSVVGGSNMQKVQNDTDFSCKTQMHGESMSVLDRCMYDAGRYPFHRCPGIKSIKDVAVARFNGNDENSYCSEALKRKEGQTNDHSAPFCMELRAEWLNLIRESTLENNVIS